MPRTKCHEPLSGIIVIMNDNKAAQAASIRARLLNLSREKKIDFNRILTSYGLDRLLYRLSVSEYRDEFVLKGAMLFSYWSGDAYRATRDVDFLKSGDASITYLSQVFKRLCEQGRDIEDGLIFDVSSVHAEEIREENTYGGIRVIMKAALARARIAIQADVGIGDIITPHAEVIEFPVLLDMPSPVMQAYPVETVIAEKFEAMVHLGMANSRMKDFYDIWAIFKYMNPDKQVLAAAIANTFERRGTMIPTDAPLALTEEFSANQSKQKQWMAFVRRAAVVSSAKKTLQETVEDIRPRSMRAESPC